MNEDYDYLGNYIGPDIIDSDEEEAQQPEEPEQSQQAQPDTVIVNQHRIVLHQDKKYYPTHEQMYPEAETLIEQEDQQTLQTPIIAKALPKVFDLVETLTPVYSLEFAESVSQHPKSIRNVCIAGHLHHGKTLLMDILIQQTHVKNWNLERNYRWMDTRVDEQQRLISVKDSAISLLLQDTKGKSYMINFIDTPGHPNFTGELSCAMRICDGVVLVVDAVEGVMMMTQRVIKQALRQRLRLVVFVSKMDRLVLELKLPPEDAYLKIKHTLEEINTLIQKAATEFSLNKDEYIVSPLLGNVVFGSGEYSFMFSLDSFSRLYSKHFKDVDHNMLKNVFWGDFYFNHKSHKFQRKPDKEVASKRAFVEFVLQPMYKIFSHVVGKDKPQLEPFLAQLGVFLKSEQYRLNIKSLVKLIFQRYLSVCSPLVDAITNHIQSPAEQTKRIIDAHYTGSQTADSFYDQIIKCSRDGPLYIHTVKMFNKVDCKSFDVFGRVLSGTIREGQQLRIMGQAYTTDEQEDMFVKPATKLYQLQGRERRSVKSVSAGNFVLIEGIDMAVTKTATIVDSRQSLVHIIRPIKFWTIPVVKVAIEPLVPSDLPKLLEALRRANKSYPLMYTKVEESGEHVIMGTGEVEMDSILHDIREMYSDIEVKISDPSVCFCQTIIDTSGIKCYADTPNKKNRITALASPLQKGLAETIEKQIISLNNTTHLSEYLENHYDWDILASNNVWAFGPNIEGPNVLVNDSYPTSTNQKLLGEIRSSLVQGFRWSTREGPLCDQPMRNVKFRVIEAQLSDQLNELAPGQLIPTARRAFYSAFLTATPRLMQPVLATEIQCTSDSINAVYSVIAKRRGTVFSEKPKAGSPLYTIEATIPAIDSFGFETDLRVHTTGEAFCLSIFDHWNMLTGDPLDKKIVLRPLEPLQPHQLPREFMIKTRRRKGLNEQVSIVKYFDDLNIRELLRTDASYREFI